MLFGCGWLRSSIVCAEELDQPATVKFNLHPGFRFRGGDIRVRDATGARVVGMRTITSLEACAALCLATQKCMGPRHDDVSAVTVCQTVPVRAPVRLSSSSCTCNQQAPPAVAARPAACTSLHRHANRPGAPRSCRAFTYHDASETFFRPSSCWVKLCASPAKAEPFQLGLVSGTLIKPAGWCPGSRFPPPRQPHPPRSPSPAPPPSTCACARLGTRRGQCDASSIGCVSPLVLSITPRDPAPYHSAHGVTAIAISDDLGIHMITGWGVTSAPAYKPTSPQSYEITFAHTRRPDGLRTLAGVRVTGLTVLRKAAWDTASYDAKGCVISTLIKNATLHFSNMETGDMVAVAVNDLPSGQPVQVMLTGPIVVQPPALPAPPFPPPTCTCVKFGSGAGVCDTNSTGCVQPVTVAVTPRDPAPTLARDYPGPPDDLSIYADDLGLHVFTGDSGMSDPNYPPNTPQAYELTFSRANGTQPIGGNSAAAIRVTAVTVVNKLDWDWSSWYTDLTNVCIIDDYVTDATLLFTNLATGDSVAVKVDGLPFLQPTQVVLLVPIVVQAGQVLKISFSATSGYFVHQNYYEDLCPVILDAWQAERAIASLQYELLPPAPPPPSPPAPAPPPRPCTCGLNNTAVGTASCSGGCSKLGMNYQAVAGGGGHPAEDFWYDPLETKVDVLGLHVYDMSYQFDGYNYEQGYHYATAFEFSFWNEHKVGAPTAIAVRVIAITLTWAAERVYPCNDVAKFTAVRMQLANTAQQTSVDLDLLNTQPLEVASSLRLELAVPLVINKGELLRLSMGGSSWYWEFDTCVDCDPGYCWDWWGESGYFLAERVLGTLEIEPLNS